MGGKYGLSGVRNSMKRGTKKKVTENLTDSNIKYVISLLEADKPITKKEACDILKISYNTTRLNKLIEEWKENQEYRARRKAEKRGKPATNAEISNVVESYLEGDNVASISKRLYRSSLFVKNIINRVGVPDKGDGNYTVATILPEECISDDFDNEEVAWSAIYDAPCTIIQKYDDKRYIPMYGTSVYQIWVKQESEMYPGSGGFYATSAAYDIGKLEHLKNYGVNTERL